MRSSFFARWALPILCLIFFMVPFGLRGSRLSLTRMKNDVKDWLPDSFKETAELTWFAKHFAGERFVVATWPGCSTDDPRYHQMKRLLQAEIEPPADQPLPEDPRQREDELARQLGRDLGLFFTGDYSENWGGRGEKWLQGNSGLWYYITPDGQLHKWTAANNVMGRMLRGLKRWRGSEKVEGALVAEWAPTDPQRYFENPQLLTERLFRSVMTGPDATGQLAEPGGALWPRGDVAEEDKPEIARRRAVERLTGSLFGPDAPPDFQWTVDSLDECMPAATRTKLPADWQEKAAVALQRIGRNYDHDPQRMAAAPSIERERNWYRLFDLIGVEPPAPMTCFFLTLSEGGQKNLSRVVGRPMLGKPRGQVYAIAEACGVPALGADAELRLGGPPVDNVSIDEEGTITLVRLLGFSLLLGIGLSYLSFRSIPVTIMVFLVGGISAVASLSIVYWSGASVDAILMSMPSLVYVLGLSGAVHIVNYYRDAAQEHGLERAPEVALSHGWGPCTLAAFTTALGLLSLYASNILPIRKFGLYSAIGVMTTLALLFTYLPSALQLWPPGYHKRRCGEAPTSKLSAMVSRFWLRVSDITTRHYGKVIVGILLCMSVISLGLFRIRTSVQLLKLFDGNAKIIRDYRWLEQNLGELVPMEVVVRVPPDKIRTPFDQTPSDAETEADDIFRYSMLERAEIAQRIQRVLEDEFGEQGRDQVGRGISLATFVLDDPPVAADVSFFSAAAAYRRLNNRRLERRYDELLGLEYLQKDTAPGHQGSELWRISLRLGALNDIDYGLFVHQLADAVEPALAAYRYREMILRDLDRSRRSRGEEGGFLKARVLFLGARDPASEDPEWDRSRKLVSQPVDQTHIFARSLQDLLISAGFDGDYLPLWMHPSQQSLTELFEDDEALAAALQQHVDCVVLVNDTEEYDRELLSKHARVFIDATDHVYQAPEESHVALARRDLPPESKTAAERDDGVIHAIYTGVVPVVYKAQRTLLYSLADSIGWAFVMIAGVMMVLLRSGPWRRDNLLCFRGGLLSMIPNVFPAVIIFGLMGHMRLMIDIGSMMTASVAMGVAVDDTIHFLTWFRAGVRDGLCRNDAIRLAYDRCATAMTQTTLIGGVGLSVFAVSTFTPTQRFGILMLAMLAAALIGDLVLLPALLASPWGRFFAPKPSNTDDQDGPTPLADAKTPAVAAAEAGPVPTTDLPAGIRFDAPDAASSAQPPAMNINRRLFRPSTD